MTLALYGNIDDRNYAGDQELGPYPCWWLDFSLRNDTGAADNDWRVQRPMLHCVALTRSSKVKYNGLRAMKARHCLYMPKIPQCCFFDHSPELSSNLINHHGSICS